MISDTLFSSQRSDWETPDELFKALDNEFHFTLDVCANATNKKCSQYLSPCEDGLTEEWEGVCWCNPPYGRDVSLWLKKACRYKQDGVTTVCLLPARTDTKWFHNLVLHEAEIRFLPGRIKFVGAKYPAPFPSMIAIYKGWK